MHVPFVMEVVEGTEGDAKGRHIARRGGCERLVVDGDVALP
jgi:hypothetical protein